MWGYHDGMGWWMVFAGGGMLAFWVVVVGVVTWVIRRSGYSNRPDRDGDVSPVRIARRRLASGEITLEQFEELRKALE